MGQPTDRPASWNRITHQPYNHFSVGRRDVRQNKKTSPEDGAAKGSSAPSSETLLPRKAAGAADKDNATGFNPLFYRNTPPTEISSFSYFLFSLLLHQSVKIIRRIQVESTGGKGDSLEFMAVFFKKRAGALVTFQRQHFVK